MQIRIARDVASIACVELDLVLRNSKKKSKFLKWERCELDADLHCTKHSFYCSCGNERVLRKVQEKVFLEFFEISRRVTRSVSCMIVRRETLLRLLAWNWATF